MKQRNVMPDTKRTLDTMICQRATPSIVVNTVSIFALVLPGLLVYSIFAVLWRPYSSLSSTSTVLKAVPQNIQTTNNSQRISYSANLTDIKTGKSTLINFAATHKPVVISFWATWCQYCPLELGDLQMLSQHYGAQVQFFAVNSADSPQAVAEYVKHTGLNLPVFCDSNHRMEKRYGVQEYPFLIILGTNGMVQYTHVGYSMSERHAVSTMLLQMLRTRGSKS